MTWIEARRVGMIVLLLLVPAVRAEGQAPPAGEETAGKPTAESAGETPAPPPLTFHLEYMKEYLSETPARVVATGRIHIAQGEAEILVRDGGVVLWVDPVEWRRLRKGEAPANADALLGVAILELYAEGAVLLRTEGQEVRAERIYANFVENRAVILRGELLARIGEEGEGPRIPLLVRAERIVQTTKNEIRSEKARVTSDLSADPHHELIVKEMVIRRRGKKFSITGESLTLVYEGIPIFWVPRVSGSSTRGTDPLRDVDVGASSKYGYFLGLDLGYRLWSDETTADEPWGDVSISPVYRTRRGFGIGGNFDYKGDSFEGDVLGFYQYDGADEDQVLQEPVPRNDRGRLRWQHFHEFSADAGGKRLHGTAEISWLSDSGFLAEYYTNEFKEKKAQEDVGYLSWAGGSVATAVTYKWWANDFETQTTYTPRLSADVFRMAIARNILGTEADVNFSGEADAARVYRAYAEGLGERGVSTNRLLLRGRVDVPFNLGPVRVSPMFGAGYTLYGNHQDQQRVDLSTSVRAAVDFWRVFPDVRSDTFDISGLRHVMDLSAGYASRFAVTADSDEIFVSDMYDLLDEIDAVDLRMRHRFETKRRGEIVTFLEVELRALYFPTELSARPAPFGPREEYEQGMNSLLVPEEETWRTIDRRGWGPMLGELRAQIWGNLFFAGDVWYDVETGLFETYSEGLRYEGKKEFSFLVAHRTIQGDASLVTAWIDTRLTDRWSVRLLHQQDISRSESLVSGLKIRRRYPDFIFELSLNYNQKRNDTGINFTIEPAAVFDRKRARDTEDFLDFDRMKWYR